MINILIQNKDKMNSFNYYHQQNKEKNRVSNKFQINKKQIN